MTEQTLETEIALMRQELKIMSEESRYSRAGIKREIEGIKVDVAAMKQQSAKWKGGLMVLVGIGGLFVGFLTVWEKLLGLIKG